MGLLVHPEASDAFINAVAAAVARVVEGHWLGTRADAVAADGYDYDYDGTGVGPPSSRHGGGPRSSRVSEYGALLMMEEARQLQVRRSTFES